MNNEFLGHHPDPDIQALVHDAADALVQALEGLESGEFPPPGEGLSPEQQRRLCEVVQCLCDEGSFLYAAPIALMLAIHQPRNGSHWFSAGRVLQRMGAFDAAASLYLMSLQDRALRPVALYRLGECLTGQGRTAEALHFFDAAFDLACAEDGSGLLNRAAAAIEQVRAGPRAS